MRRGELVLLLFFFLRDTKFKKVCSHPPSHLRTCPHHFECRGHVPCVRHGSTIQEGTPSARIGPFLEDHGDNLHPRLCQSASSR